MSGIFWKGEIEEQEFLKAMSDKRWKRIRENKEGIHRPVDPWNVFSGEELQERLVEEIDEWWETVCPPERSGKR